MKFDFCETLFVCIMCIICVFQNIALDIFLKGKGTHQCDLFSQEELNIENHGNYAIMTASIDQWHAGIGLFYQESAKLRAIRANVQTCLPCSRAWHA